MTTIEELLARIEDFQNAAKEKRWGQYPVGLSQTVVAHVVTPPVLRAELKAWFEERNLPIEFET